jgi:hypothetical protein
VVLLVSAYAPEALFFEEVAVGYTPDGSRTLGEADGEYENWFSVLTSDAVPSCRLSEVLR